MKNLFVFMTLTILSTTAFAECKNQSIIKKAAEKTFTREEQAVARKIHYEGLTRTGKDKFTIEMTFTEECTAEATVFMKKDTCDVAGSFKYIPDGACG